MRNCCQKRNRGEPMRSTPALACNQACLGSDLRWQRSLVPGESSRLATKPKCQSFLPCRKKIWRWVGAGPAGLAFAINAAARWASGKHCLMPTARSAGSLISPNRIPGKEEFLRNAALFTTDDRSDGRDAETQSHRGRRISYRRSDETILASGIVPRVPPIDGDRSSGRY
ncbi:2,4-dienoyl-CoA reductase [Escherichia coli]|uniref:2,4-dienoyl-CoA reductase n=1 Tax=Escherichia coli TaxID=562 RepID=A0A2X3K000_ECOLX|nr:2,4-dienoyl-CoA reductase [Escherichia coli]